MYYRLIVSLSFVSVFDSKYYFREIAFAQKITTAIDKRCRNRANDIRDDAPDRQADATSQWRINRLRVAPPAIDLTAVQ